MTPSPIPGLHHVTAIAGDPATNVAFYRDLLGLRLVKKTVNFDDPGTYHLYYGDGVGSPGTILTFFPWPGARRGRRGVGQTTTTSLAVPIGALPFWQARFAEHGVLADPPTERDGVERLTFFDPDGLRLELVASAESGDGTPWQEGPVPADAAVRGFFGVTLTESRIEPTATLLTEVLGFAATGEGTDRITFALPGDALGRRIEVVASSDGVGQIAAGTVHHVAFRVADDEAELAWRDRLLSHGLAVSPVMDRNYFHSIYFREPGGVLFEIATDPPGFTVDEEPSALGSELQLPARLEPHRARIEAALPPLAPAAEKTSA